MSKLRLSDHKLQIEVGRHSKTPNEARICQFCQLNIEKEVHFLLNGPYITNPANTFLINSIYK